MARKTEIQRLRSNCDTLWSKIVRAVNKNECQVCVYMGISDPSTVKDAHHIMGRRNLVRWDLENGMCLCKKHHKRGEIAAHTVAFDGQYKFHRIMVDLYGTEKLEELSIKKNTEKVWKITEMRTLHQHLSDFYNKLTQ